ncbi:MAG TPA: DinB family protein [Chthonomonadaceae bacterium]|nr:DinB family protein [Chthonomonadaceae bacterium]
MSALQPKQHLREMIQSARHRLVNDLKAIPAEKQNERPGGCARSALHIVAECATLNGTIATFLRTGTMNRLSREEREAHLRSFDTEETALAYLEQETQRLLEAVDTLDENTLGDVSTEPLGRPMSRFALAGLPAGHMMYHDGQLNYIQTLHGDDKIHWS